MPTYRVHDTIGDDLGLIEHPAPNIEPGDVVMLADGREALVTARVEAKPGPLEALLEVAVAPQANQPRPTSCYSLRPVGTSYSRPTSILTRNARVALAGSL